MINTSSTKKSSELHKIAFVGLTHLGLVTSICTASLKKEVLALDEDKNTIYRLSKNEVTIPEPNLENLLKKSRKYFHPSSDFTLLKNSSIVFISLDTPTYSPFNLTKLNRLIAKTIQHLSDQAIIVIMSQVPVGFCRKLSDRISSSDSPIQVYYFLNTLIIGDSINRFLKPERVVIGMKSSSKSIHPRFENFLKLFKAPIFKMSYESAELTKSAVNLYLASSIISANTLSDYCEKVGADINEIIPALKSDKRIGQFAYLKPTLRVSGGHLERELIKLKVLAKKYKMDSGIVDPLIKLNNQRLKWLIKKVTDLSKKGNIQIITLWGLSYKKDTDSVDNAASIEIIKKLSSKFHFQVYDPKAILPKNLSGFKRFQDKYSALRNSDLLIILTDWNEFKEIDYPKTLQYLNNPHLIDCVDIIPKNITAVRMGFPS